MPRKVKDNEFDDLRIKSEEDTSLQENKWKNLKPIDLAKIETVPFEKDQYFQEIHPKKQIILHHTISGEGVNGDISSWENDPKRVATCIIIDRGGIPWQLFSSKYWAGHLGAGNLILDKQSIGVEIDNWGWFIPGDGTPKQFGLNSDGTPKIVNTIIGKFYAYYGNSVIAPMQYYPDSFRGYNYYEKYTDAQIQTLGELLLYWNKIYGIPLTYNQDMWGVSSNALSGKPGVWTHVSYRPYPEKSDAHPQPQLIEMLKSISS